MKKTASPAAAIRNEISLEQFNNIIDENADLIIGLAR